MSGAESGADPSAVGPYLAAALGDERWASCRVSHVQGGKSNLTYVVASPAGEVILRRPPLGHVLPTAHDVRREFQVISALRDTRVPVPAALHYCADESVVGAPFYAMQRVIGHVVRADLPNGFAEDPADRVAMAAAVVDVLVAIHEVDYAGVGLAEFGRPAGYLDRQLARWGRQWEATRAVEDAAVDRLARRLGEAVPESGDATLVHGDYRLDNTVLGPDDPAHVAAVLDWEMSTLGDPLADLGILLVYWSEPADASDVLRQGAIVVPTATRLPGFPGRAEVARRYAERSGRDVAALAWYVAFGFYKLAVVCAGIVARARGGAMVGEGFVEAEERIGPLAALGHRVLDGGAW